MPIHELKEQIARLPEQPGVYLYFNAEGDTIYVGKARALRDRVRNYLGASGFDAKRDALLDEIARLEVIVTARSYSSAEHTVSTHGAMQRLMSYSRHGRPRFPVITSLHDRMPNNRWVSDIVRRAKCAGRNGPA